MNHLASTMSNVPALEIGQLSIGTRFMSVPIFGHPYGLPPFPTTTGTLLYIGPGGVEVALDGCKMRNGEPETERWQSAVSVHKLDNVPAEVVELNRKLNQQHRDSERYGTIGVLAMATKSVAVSVNKPVVSDSTIQSIVTRFNFQQTKLTAALENDDAEGVEKATTAIARIRTEAATAGVGLPGDGQGQASVPPAQEAGATEGGGDGGDGEGEEVTDPSMPQATLTKKQRKAKEREDANAKRKEALAAHKAEQKAAKPARVKKEKKLRPCLEGCGQMVPGNFAMGHDAKLKSLLLKIERGEEDQTKVPEIAQELVTFKKGELVTEKDEKGKVTSKTQLMVLTKAPVKFQGRDDIQVTQRAD